MNNLTGKPARDGSLRSCSAEASISAGAAEGGAFRLDKRTYLNRSHYSVKVRNYGEGLVEAGWSFVGVGNTPKAGRGQSQDREKNEDRACRRASSKLSQLLLASGTDYLLTLTFRENLTEYKTAKRLLSAFIRRVKKVYPRWTYIAVAERQERGAWHWHVAVKGWQDVAFLRGTWQRLVVGQIDVKAPKGTGKRRRLNLARYLTKYMGKSFSELRELNAHRYQASLNIAIPCEVFKVPEAFRHRVAEFVISLVRDMSGAEVYVWHAERMPAGWVCSW